MSITLTAREARPASGLILLTMSLGVLIAQIDTSVVNLAVKPIGTDLKASVTELQWIVDVYNFVYASLLLTAGTLADLYGRRRIFALGIALFTLGTVVCGLAPDVPTLVAGRAVAGLGAALEMSASLAILTIAYPDTKERTHALGIWASCYGIAIVIGPTAGGALVDASGWRSIFLLVIPFCLVTLALVMTVVPESSNPQGRRLDLPGQALAIASLGSLSLAAIEGPRWGWASIGSMAAFSLSVVAAALFLRRQARATDAVVPLPMLRHRVFAACLAVATAANFGAYAMLFLTPLYFQTVRGASALDAALLLLPMSLSYALTSQLSGRIANNLGPRFPMTAGMGLMGAGLLMLALIPLNDSLVLIESGLLVMGCGLGLYVGPMNAVAVANVPAVRSGTASGLINTARMIGATLGVAVLGAMFAMHVADGIGTRGLAIAYFGGGISELIGAVVAFAFIRSDSLRQPAQ
jgi:DHA2 family methylenomycin A resistance protein-like MFS transporter